MKVAVNTVVVAPPAITPVYFLLFLKEKREMTRLALSIVAVALLLVSLRVKVVAVLVTWIGLVVRSLTLLMIRVLV